MDTREQDRRSEGREENDEIRREKLYLERAGTEVSR